MAKAGNLTYITRIDPTTEEYLPAEGRRKVFISYKKSDNNLTGIRDIAANKILSMVDAAVWYDEFLTPGVDYKDEIIKAITECDALVLLLTREILASSFVWDVEIETAKQQKKGIIPIAFDISKEDFAVVEDKLGETVQIIRWPVSNAEGGELSDEDMEEALKFDNAFGRALDRFVINADLAMRIEQFFASGKNDIGLVKRKDLTDEQKYLMGMGYFRGVGVETDTEKGIEILDAVAHTWGEDEETAALKGRAAWTLDEYYYYLEKYEEAYKYASIGAACNDPDSLYRLGEMLYNGLSCDSDTSKAIEYFSRAADKEQPDACILLAKFYHFGFNIDQDDERSVELYRVAARAGNENAALKLAEIYYEGKYGVEKDISTAVRMYEKLAESGNTGAMNRLYYIYSKDFSCTDSAKAESYKEMLSMFSPKDLDSEACSDPEGSQTSQFEANYAYCSYAKDKKSVAKGIIDELKKSGYRIIGSDSLSENEKSEIIRNSRCFIALLSKDYINEAKENHYLLSERQEGKTILLGCLDDVLEEKPAGNYLYLILSSSMQQLRFTGDNYSKSVNILKNLLDYSGCRAASSDTPAAPTEKPRKKSFAGWLVPLIILLALIATAVGAQLSGLFDILGWLGGLLG